MPNKNRRQHQTYDRGEIERLRSIPLPAKLKCNMCDKNRPQISFSNKQLNDVRSQIAREGRMTETPKCLSCSGGRIVELECASCHKTKGLEEFARSQRKVQDTATCYSCTEVQVTRDAVREATYEKPENMFIKTDSSRIYYPDYFSSASSTHDTDSTISEWTEIEALDGSRRNNKDGGIDLSAQFQQDFSKRGAVTETLIESEYSQVPARGTRTAASSWNTSSAPSASRSSSRVPGTPSVSGTVRTFNSSIAEHSQASHSGTGRSGFAKIRASDTVVDPYLWGKNTTRPSSPSSSDDDGGNDDDDDDDDAEAGRRPRGNGNARGNGNIRGPHSALTDFLAANNISAQEIRDSYRDRVQRAEQDAAAGTDNGEGPSNAGGDAEADVQAESSAMAAERTRKRKRNQDEAIAKIKKGKEAKKKASKKKKKGAEDESDEDFMDMYKKAKKLPGQFENCELCDKRFTVTPYSQAGPEGGLLCTPCGKELKKEAKAQEKAKQKPVIRKGRRKIESNRLDGMTVRGPKTLQQLCIEKLAKHSEDIDELGEMPENIMNKISEIFSKKRAMNPTTMKLFLQPDMDTVAIHEAANLETEDFDQIFAVCPTVKKLSLRNCCQFKDSNIDYIIEKAKSLVDIQLLGANLVSNDKWIELFIARGGDLKSLKLEWLDAAFDDQAVEALTTFCPKIERLKLERCKKLGVDSIDAIARLEQLEHLTLRFYDQVPREKLIHMLTSVGAHLRTLCLEHFMDSDSEPTDDILDAIHKTCRHISKFRFSENTECTDDGYVHLFTDWANPPLHYIDVNSLRDMDNTNPDGPTDYPIGLASGGFQALMAHSGSRLEYLDISSCRHISHATFTDTFDGQKQYPHLRSLNLSFCPVVDTQVVAGIFRSCPALAKLVTFGCFQVSDVVVPKGVVLIGAPRAQDQIEQFGETLMEFQLELQREMESMRVAGRVMPMVA